MNDDSLNAEYVTRSVALDYTYALDMTRALFFYPLVFSLDERVRHPLDHQLAYGQLHNIRSRSELFCMWCS